MDSNFTFLIALPSFESADDEFDLTGSVDFGIIVSNLI